MHSCKKVSACSRFTPLPGAALTIALATRMYLPSEVQQELELGRPLAVYVQLQEGVSSFAFYSLARGCSGYCAGHQSVPAIRSAARTRAGAATSGVCPVARRCQFVRILLPCPGLLWLLRWPPECTCHPKRSKNRTVAATSGVCPVARRCQLVRVLLP